MLRYSKEHVIFQKNLLELVKTKGILVKRMTYEDSISLILELIPMDDCKEYLGAVPKKNLFGNITHVYCVYEDFDGNIKYYDYPQWASIDGKFHKLKLLVRLYLGRSEL